MANIDRLCDQLVHLKYIRRQVVLHRQQFLIGEGAPTTPKSVVWAQVFLLGRIITRPTMAAVW